MGLSKERRSPVRGWSNARRAAWRAGRSRLRRASRAAARRRGRRAGAAVGRVARHRVAEGGQVDADLVRAAGVDAHAQQGRAVEAPPRPRSASAPRARAAARTDMRLRCTRVAADRRVDRRPPSRRGTPRTRARYSFSTRAAGELRAPATRWVASSLATTIRPDVPRSRRCTMPGPQHAADAREVLDVVQQRVDQRAARRVPAPGCTTRPGRLVHHQEVRVLVDDASGMSSGRGVRRRGGGPWTRA